MKIARIVCLLLCLLLVAGCSGKSESPKTADSSGDMETALQALKWEDYDTALAQSAEFLKRVPHSNRAKNVQETAAWSKLTLAEDLDTELSRGTLKKDNSGFSVTDIPQNPDAGFQIVSYRVNISYDWTYFQQDIQFPHIYVSSISIIWQYTDDEENHTYLIDSPADLCKTDFAGKMLPQSYYGDQMMDETHEKFAAFLQEDLAKSLDEVFGKIKQKTGLTSQALGFDAWNP